MESILTTLQPGPVSQSLQDCIPNLPLPVGASKEAILMRRAGGQAIIFLALTRHIFRPFHVSEEFREATDLMLQFFKRREEQNIYRYQVMKFADDADMEMAMEAADKAAHFISSHLDRMVSTAKVGNFRRQIEDYLADAAEMWVREAQRASDLVEVIEARTDHELLESYPEFRSRNNTKGEPYCRGIIPSNRGQ